MGVGSAFKIGVEIDDKSCVNVNGGCDEGVLASAKVVSALAISAKVVSALAKVVSALAKEVAVFVTC